MIRTLAGTLLAAVPLAGLLWLSGAARFLPALGAMLVLVLVVQLAGRLLLRAASAPDMPLAADWVLGVVAVSLAVYALAHFFDLRAATAFAGCATLVLVLAAVFRERDRAPVKRDELIGLALCGMVTIVWCKDIAEAPMLLAKEGFLPAWIDYFIHGGVISQFGDPRAVRESIYLADYPALFYHYASYMLAAVFAGVLDLPGLPAATSVWLPLGFFTLCAGAYVLGAGLAGAAGGVAAVAVLTLVPDPSNYGLENGFLSFHWHMLATPGASYVVGTFLLSAALLNRWAPHASLRPLLASGAIAASSLLFRVHVFALGFPAWMATAALASRRVRERKLLAFGAAFLAFLLFVIAFYLATDSDLAVELFLAGVHNLQEPTAYRGWYRSLLGTYGPMVATPAGILLMYAGCLGVFVILYPIAALVARRSGERHIIDVLPPLLVAVYLLLMLTAPIAQYRDPTEFTVRPFVLLYAAVAVWTVCVFVRALASRFERGHMRAWAGLLVASVVALPLVWHATGTMGRLPKFYWGWHYFSQKIEPGLVRSAAFLRQSAGRGDVFAVRGLKLGWNATDWAIQLVSLSGMAAYLAYPHAHIAEGGKRGKAALQRYTELARIDRAQSPAQAIAALRALGIDWYVVAGGEGPPWDRDRRHAAFVDGRVSVYSSRE